MLVFTDCTTPESARDEICQWLRVAAACEAYGFARTARDHAINQARSNALLLAAAQLKDAAFLPAHVSPRHQPTQAPDGQTVFPDCPKPFVQQP